MKHTPNQYKRLFSNPAMTNCRIEAGFADLLNTRSTLNVGGAEVTVTTAPTLTRYVKCVSGDAVFICRPSQTMPTVEPASIVAMNNQARELLNKRVSEFESSFVPLSATAFKAASA